jgi:hypothetical protein
VGWRAEQCLAVDDTEMRLMIPFVSFFSCVSQFYSSYYLLYSLLILVLG